MKHNLIKDEKIKNFLGFYLTTEESFLAQSQYRCKSSYFAALKEARGLTGRSIDSGQIISEKETGCWAGACMYFILMDHVGWMFRNNKKPVSDNIKGIRACLESFSDLNQEEIKVLRSLRNSFIHRFSLFNVPENKKNDKIRIFSVDRGDNLIVVPRKDIPDEEYKILPEEQLEYTTAVSLKEIGNLAEKIHREILNLLKSDDLIVVTRYNKSVESILSLNLIYF